MKIIRNKRRAVSASQNPRCKRPIKASASPYDNNMQKIQYYAKKVVADINNAADIFAKAREGWTPIEIPDVPGDDLFYERYVTDYIELFDSNHSKDEEIYELRGGRNIEYAVRYGYFDSNDLENYGDDEDALYDFMQSFNYMEDIYYVTTEFGHTIADLATDPYAVFDDVFGDDGSDKLYYSEEVLAEFDLLTSSDRVYDFAKDAQGIVNLYNEVSDYFSYSNAKRLLSEFESGFEEEYVMKIKCNSRITASTDKLVDLIQSWVRMIDNYKNSGKKYPEAVISDLYSSMKYVLKQQGGSVNANTSIRAGYVPINASTSGKIPYDLVSMLLILRDWADVEDGYINSEHKALVDIADTLYNVGRNMVNQLSPEFKAVYDKYGESYFNQVLDDASAIDSQINSRNVNDLIAEYNDKAETYE